MKLLLFYAVLSVITFGVYAFDKSAAIRGAWRVSEKNLHTLALIGGWPGGLMAQRMLRHKSSKRSFLLVFWLAAIVNVVGILSLIGAGDLAL